MKSAILSITVFISGMIAGGSTVYRTMKETPQRDAVEHAAMEIRDYYEMHKAWPDSSSGFGDPVYGLMFDRATLTVTSTNRVGYYEPSLLYAMTCGTLGERIIYTSLGQRVADPGSFQVERSTPAP